MDNVFLIGFMGAGKTTAARCLRDCYGMRLLEMDERIEADQGMGIPELFSVKGEPYFRGLETELLRSLLEQENMVVSCGGGTAMRRENVELMRESGRIVYLEAEPETVYDRVKGTHTRPLLEGHMDVGYIRELMQKRIPAYRAAADLTVSTDGRTAEEICAEIVERIRVFRAGDGGRMACGFRMENRSR